MKTKERILSGAQELFFKHGVKSITMDDVAKHLAISKKTIYKYFSDKNELVEAMTNQLMKNNEVEFDSISDESENIVEEFFLIMKHMASLFSQMNPNLFYDLQKFHPGAWKMFKDFKEECIEGMVEGSVKRGIEQGLVRPDINSKIIARLRMEEVEMGFNPDAFPPTKFKIIDVQLALLDHFLHGICTLKGHKLINKYKELIEEE
jgi:AcrR family transcriptional regulator